MKDWIYDHVRIRALIILAIALGALSMFVSPAHAAQTRTFTITKPAGYFDGTAFGTEQLVYIIYDASNDAQLFSTQTLITKRTDVPDSASCFYVRAAVFNVTANSILPDTLGDPSASSCKPKKVGVAGLIVQ